MTTTPTRLGALPDYLFNKLEWKASALRSQGVDVISLDMGDPEGPTPELVVAAAKSALDDPATHHYTTNRGGATFRHAVADHYLRRFGLDVDAEAEVIPALGAKESVFNLNLALLDPGDLALAPDPGYQIYTAGPLLVGASAQPLPLVADNGFLPDLAAIPARVLSRAKVLFLNYPNSPTGAVAPASFFAHAVEFALTHDLVIVHDNVYSDITFDGVEAPSILGAPGAMEVAVEIVSLSKSFNMTGWRCAALVGNPGVLEAYRRVKSFIDSGMFLPVQLAGAAALAPDMDQHLSRAVATYQRRRDLVCDGLARLGFEVTPPQGSVYLWVPVPERLGSSYEFCDRVLTETGVALSPGTAYGARGEGYVRLSLTVPDERLKSALDRIAPLLG